MIDLVIGSETHKLSLYHFSPHSLDSNPTVLECTNDTQSLHYKWVISDENSDNHALDPNNVANSANQLISTSNSYAEFDICKFYHTNTQIIPFNLLYPDTFCEIVKLISDTKACGCLVISEPEFLVEDFCAFITGISQYNYKIDLSKYIYSDITCKFIPQNDNLDVYDLVRNFSNLTTKTSEASGNSRNSFEFLLKQNAEQLNVLLPHLPKFNILNLLSLIKSKTIYSFEDQLLLITIHAICVMALDNSNSDVSGLNDLFYKLNIKDSITNGPYNINKNILVTVCNAFTFSIASETEDKSFHTYQILNLLMVYMKAWYELNLPIKLIIPFEKIPNNPINLLASSDLIVKILRLPFPLMKWQRQVLFDWKLGDRSSSNVFQLVNSTNGLSLAEILNLPIMRGWDKLALDVENQVLESESDFDFTNYSFSNEIMEPQIVVGVPGVGKTSYAINLAKRMQVPLVRFSIVEYLRPEIGLTEREICKFFKSLDKYNSNAVSCVLLMDLLDAVKSYNVTSVVSRELNNLLSNNYWNNAHKIVVIVTLMGKVDDLRGYSMIKNFKVIKLEPLNLCNAVKVLSQMLNKTFANCEEVVREWKQNQNESTTYTLSQIRDIAESAKMKSLTRLLENEDVGNRLTLILEDLSGQHV